MIFWTALVVFLIPLIYAIASSSNESRARSRKLDHIQRRIAAKEGLLDFNPASPMVMRKEEPRDFEAISELLTAAFPSEAEAKLVEALRKNEQLRIAISGFVDSKLIGYVAFTPISLEGKEIGLGLAPVAVTPEFQSRGYGAQLVTTGLNQARQSGAAVVVVLGDPAYYGRFGFEPASTWKLGDEYGGGDAFQAQVFAGDILPSDGGLIKYCEEFRQ